MSKVPIQPCPFCGGASFLQDTGIADYLIECVYCDARGGLHQNPHLVIARWNDVSLRVAASRKNDHNPRVSLPEERR